MLFGCEKGEVLEDYLFSSWSLHWKQCGVYHNRYDAQISFTETDSTDFGSYSEKGFETVTFDLEILNDEEVLLFNASDSIWNGSLRINQFSRNSLEFQREQKGCVNELFRFE
jgi:hypothetical protein